MKQLSICFGMALATLIAITAPAELTFAPPTPEQFQNYWYAEGAEISRYELSQSRYGEVHEGDAVLIFVTEKMNPEIQIKADNPTEADVPILKLNALRKFYTGIYPYSVMTSVFTPIPAGQRRAPLKVTTSAQEWCGHVYTQMNLRGSDYEVRSHSYFEREGDDERRVTAAFTEDGIFNLIRLSPGELPVGEFDMLPGTVYARLLHRPLRATPATGSLAPTREKSQEGNPLVAYVVKAPGIQRTLTILFEQDFPHRIERWEESQGSSPATVARRTHTIKNLYWRHNRNPDRKLLKQLGL